MSTTIRIPTPLRKFTGGADEVSVDGSTVGDTVKALASAHPDVAKHLLDDTGALRSFVNVYLGDTNINELGGLEAPVSDGAVLSLVPAVAGGLL